jgi:hypothetical protein
MVQFSLDKPLWFAASKTRRSLETSAIFFFRYLLTGALVIVIKTFALKLSITFAWNAELIRHFIFSAIKRTNKMTIKISKAVQSDLALALIARFKSRIQIRNQGLPFSSALLSRQHLDLTAISRHSLLMQRISLSLPKTEQLQDRACPKEDSMSRLQINNNQKTWSDPALKKLTYIRKTKSTKRIEFSEILEEGKEVEKDGLVST